MGFKPYSSWGELLSQEFVNVAILVRFKESEFVDMICVIEKMCRLWLVCKLAKSLLLGDG